VYRAILPHGQPTTADSAALLVSGMRSSDTQEFENGVQARIRHEQRGLAVLCGRGREGGNVLLNLMLDQSLRLLDSRAPHLRPSAVLETQTPGSDGLRERVAELVAASAPVPLRGESPVRPGLTVLVSPADEAAGRIATAVQRLVPDGVFRSSGGSNEVVLYQESAPLLPAQIPHLTGEVSFVRPDGRRATAHTRTDVNWTSVGPR